jgi:integrase
MPRTKLTDAAVKNIRPPESGSVVHWDTITTGLGLRVTYGGTKTFIVQARVLKTGRWRDQKRSLGRYPGLSLKQARADAKLELEGAQSGKQLGGTKQERVQAQVEISRNTFGFVADEYLTKYRTRSKRKLSDRHREELRRVFNHQALSGWHDRPLNEITRRDVLDAVDYFIDKGQEVAANRYLSYLRTFFGWAIDRGIVDADPTARIKPQGEEKSRDRVLSVNELRAIWQATAPTQAGKGDLFAGIVKVLMLTGQRRTEVAAMQWPELNMEGKLWSLPGGRTKNQHKHLIPLSKPVMDVLMARQAEQADMRMRTELVFTSTGSVPFSGWSRSKNRLDGRAEKALREITGNATAVLPPWTLHDLRRTLVTRMAEDLRIPPHVIEAIVNHVSGAKAGVAGVYNRALYLDERRQALAAWATYVLQVVVPNE